MSDACANTARGICEVCSKSLEADEDMVPLNPSSERAASTGSCRAHRYCWQVARGLGSVDEARQLFAVRARATEKKRYIVIKPPRVAVGVAQLAGVFTNKRVAVLPA